MLQQNGIPGRDSKDWLPLANDDDSTHTPTMSLKNAALLALIGTVLLTVLIAVHFIFTLSGVMHDSSDGAARVADSSIREPQCLGVPLRVLPTSILILEESHLKPPRRFRVVHGCSTIGGVIRLGCRMPNKKACPDSSC